MNDLTDAELAALMEAMTLVRRIKDETEAIRLSLEAIEDQLQDLERLDRVSSELPDILRDIEKLEQRVLRIVLLAEADRPSRD